MITNIICDTAHSFDNVTQNQIRLSHDISISKPYNKNYKRDTYVTYLGESTCGSLEHYSVNLHLQNSILKSPVIKNSIVNFLDVNSTTVNYTDAVLHIVDNTLKITDSFVFSDEANVLNKTQPILKDSSGIKYLRINCQAGMYFEIELDVLKVATCIYSLPQGIYYNKSKIYGSPTSYGIFKSYLMIEDDQVIELIFIINEIQRVF